MAKGETNKIYELAMMIVALVLVLYASGLIKVDLIKNLFKEPLFRIFVVVLILIMNIYSRELSLLLLIMYVLEVSKTTREQFAPYSKEYEKTNTQTLVEPNNEIFPGCLKITAEDLINEFSGDKLALQNTLRQGYAKLLKTIPEGTSSRETLDIMSKAVGLPYSIELTDETAPIVATMLILQGFKLSESCQAPKNDIQNTGLQLSDGSLVTPHDEGDYHKF
jgi:hypothetical protein